MIIKGFSTGLYGWHERDRLDGIDSSWDDIFRRCAEAGLDAVEIDPQPELALLANRYGLKVSGAYVGLNLHEPFIPMEAAVSPLIERVAAAGGTELVVNADPKGGWGVSLPKTEDEFKRQGEHLTCIAAAAGRSGLRVSLHNHADDKHNAEGDLRSVLSYASSDVGLCIDTGWAYAAGCDPIGWLKSYPERTYAFHLRNQKGAVPTEDLLQGDIDMTELLRILAETDYNGWLTLELWHRDDNHPQRTMVEDTRSSIAFLKSHLDLAR